jgi:diguanylate cyclase (GGDEF)-like protein
VSDPDRFDLVMFVWALTILTGVVYVNLTRPEFLLHSIVDVSILCFIYFPFQNRLLYQLLIGLYFSGFNLIIIFMLRDNISHGKATVAFVHITINLIGLYVSRQLFLYRHGDYMAMKNEEGLRKKMEEIAIKDSLSGLASRWHFFEEATQSMNIFLRYQRRFSLILVDIDNLKLLNDRYGHLTGDDIIRSVASVIRQNLRKTDIAGRVGGDEFAILLPETPLSSASEISNRILLHSRSIEVQASGETIRPTISMGVIESMKLDTDFAESYRRADAAMYRAKMCGRDRMEISPPLELSLEPDPISM